MKRNKIKNTNICAECDNKNFSSAAQLDRHRLQVHTNDIHI